MSKIVIKKSARWSSVPDDVFENQSISLAGRAVLGWLLGRPDGWELFVSHLQRTLGLSDHVWKTIKKQIIAAGYFVQARRQGHGGKLEWVHEIHYPPLSPCKTIPKKSTDGGTIDGATSGGKVGARTEEGFCLTKDNNSSLAATAMPPATPACCGSSLWPDWMPAFCRLDWRGDLVQEMAYRVAAARAKGKAIEDEAAYASEILRAWGKAGKPLSVAKKIAETKQHAVELRAQQEAVAQTKQRQEEKATEASQAALAAANACWARMTETARREILATAVECAAPGERRLLQNSLAKLAASSDLTRMRRSHSHPIRLALAGRAP